MHTLPADVAESLPPGTRSREPGMARDAHSRWLRELERAQSAVQARAQPAESTIQLQAAEGADHPARGRVPRQEGSIEGRSHAAPRPAGPSPSSGQRDRGEAPVRAPGGTQTEMAQAGFGASPAVRLARTDGPRASPTPQPANRPVPAVAWPQAHAHLLVQEEAAHVWLRDAAIGKRAHRELVGGLRARLRELGLRLAELWINGHRVEGPAAIEDRSHPAEGERHGD